jgi:hypothetical protein
MAGQQSTVDDIPTVDDIRRQMANIRGRMDDDAEAVRMNALQLMDWKYYIRRHPVASLIAVAAAGYLLVPKPAQSKKVYLDPEATEKILNDQRSLHVETRAEEKASNAGAKGGLLMSLGALALNAALRYGTAYATQRMRQAFLKDFQPTR